jgi:glucan 1,3-beta-glucosidase
MLPVLVPQHDDDLVSTSSASTTTVVDDKPNPSDPSNNHKSWIRGVNLGGWLVLERYIVPSQFAISNCHVQVDLCWYPGQVSAPPHYDSSYRLYD